MESGGDVLRRIARVLQEEPGKLELVAEDVVLILVEKSDKRTVIKVQGGKEETIPAEDIEEFKQDKKSLMPEGVENQMTTQELADLFALLTLEGPPTAKDNAKISGTPENLHSKKSP